MLRADSCVACGVEGTKGRAHRQQGRNAALALSLIRSPGRHRCTVVDQKSGLLASGLVFLVRTHSKSGLEVRQ